MVVDEKGMLKAMKEAYKTWGYTVIMEDRSGIDNLIVHTNAWTVVMQKDEVPGKILGLITEHLRKLPMPGEAFLVRRKETQVAMYDVAMNDIFLFRTGEKKREFVRKTSLTLDGFSIWQGVETKTAVKVCPEYEAVLAIGKAHVFLVGNNVLFADDLESMAYIHCKKPKEEAQLEQLAYLAAFQWDAQ